MPFFFYALAFSCLFCATWLCAALVRRMIGLAIMDHPVHRSAHATPTPKGGGIGVMVAFGLFFPLMQLLTGQPVLSLSCILTACALVLLCSVSWLDDLYQWPPTIKLAAQTAAACMVVGGSISLSWPTPLTGAILSVLWLIFMTNATNFMDGLNGLISGCLSCAAVALAVVAPTFGVPELQWPSLLLACSLLGFLPFNFPHARIFMGDVGSQGCGLLAGTAALYIASHTTLPGGWLLGPALLFPLIYDVVFTLIRRGCAGHPLLRAHRGHLYQILHRSHVPVPVLSCLEWCMTLWGCAIASLVAPAANIWTSAGGLALLMLPQLAWTAFTVARTRTHPVGRW
ncbi:UDP-phosphate alpha-N-acetylglucosaminephosphotransferase [Acetobacter okinawensis]|uniref:UDP-phosphate alpha-N-acetylglucosaminephosphotransferase n=1 Tax=Acetobacter okinawensis TaxID=1076594 RepID=UPI001BA7F5D1|nr:UDP-phosphate alpha-N-acetylglucosaminephosphotransferase [Acetobacter okinawensis]MBS0987281.1 UDP-phosphate alpha-N-acetylglucosaminephosphotransferase [Acetobacter okinawensis]